MKRKGEEPACKWRRFQRRAPSEATLRKWFSQSGLDGLAVVCGDASNLVVRDFDKAEGYEQWAAAHPELAATLPTVKTARGYHIYFRSDFRGIRHEADGELRGAGYCLLPPSVHPSGPTYEWVVALPEGEFPELNPLEAGLGSVETERTEITEAIRGRSAFFELRSLFRRKLRAASLMPFSPPNRRVKDSATSASSNSVEPSRRFRLSMTLRPDSSVPR